MYGTLPILRESVKKKVGVFTPTFIGITTDLYGENYIINLIQSFGYITEKSIFLSLV